MSRIYGYGIWRSMVIAFRNFMRKPITVQYPHEKIELPERARWAVAMNRDEEGNHRCTACLACERACPDYVIKIDVTQAEDRSKHVDRWHYEVGACMMCGLCVEACAFDAICMSHEYELARTDPATLAYDLLSDTPAAAPKRRAAAEKPAADKPEAEKSAAAEPADKPAAAEPADKPAAAEPAAEPAAEEQAAAEPAADEGGSDA